MLIIIIFTLCPALHSTYTKRNCQYECLTNVIYSRCKCIMYYMPLFYENATICSDEHDKCLSKIPAKYASLAQCDCPPACSELLYGVSTSFAQLLEKNPITTATGLHSKNLAVLHAYFPIKVLRGYDRRELVTFTDFLCECPWLFSHSIHFRSI